MYKETNVCAARVPSGDRRHHQAGVCAGQRNLGNSVFIVESSGVNLSRQIDLNIGHSTR